MKRKLLIAVLALGTLGGFTVGFASMCKHRHHRRGASKHVAADICADAVRKAQRPK